MKHTRPSLQATIVGSLMVVAVGARAAAAAVPASAGARADEPAGAACDPDWIATFGGLAQLDKQVLDFAVFDDGAGPALYVAGEFRVAGGSLVNCIARWDGTSWAALAGGVGGVGYPGVFCLAVFDDGSGAGPALYAGGAFYSAGGVPASCVAKWNGSSWEALGDGLDGGVYALAVFDDGSGAGPQLHAGGSFTSSGGAPMNRLAKWDGTKWSALGSGADERVDDLAVYDDGIHGPALYLAGLFTTAGGLPASHIARWNGSSFSDVAGGMNQWGVYALEVFDDGSGHGAELYAGGSFTSAGGVPAGRIARWDGAAWRPVGNGLGTYAVYSLSTFDDGSGDALYAGGNFTLLGGGAPASRVAKWDGSSWSALGSGVSGNSARVMALAAYDDGAGTGPKLCVGGNFVYAGGSAAEYAALWDGSSWDELGSDAETALDGGVRALAVYDDDSGGGAALHVAGDFGGAGDVPLGRIAKWTGSAWSPLGEGMDQRVAALVVHEDLAGRPLLYAGGGFTRAGAVHAYCVASWNGTSWHDVGVGMNDEVLALASFDDGSGSGPQLYAGGWFFQAGYVSAPHVARWDGSTWSSLGSGVDAPVHAFALHDDGSGSGAALYAGGAFTSAGGAPAAHVARWDGASWSALGAGTNGTVHALAVHDDGSGGGAQLHAAGEFAYAGGSPAQNVARWDGSAWSPLGSGFEWPVYTLFVHDDGSGPALYAGGSGGGEFGARHVARWDGSSWEALGDGTSGAVRAFASLDEPFGAGPALYAGGDFLASAAGDSHVAKWSCASAVLGTPFCVCDGSGAPAPCGNTGGSGEGCANSSGVGAVLTAFGSSSVEADDLRFEAIHLLPGQPALLFAGDTALNGGDGIAFGDGLRCAGGEVRRLGIASPSPSGAAGWGPGLAAAGGFVPGDTRHFQVWYRDPGGSPCGARFNLTHGVEVLFTR